MGQDVHVQTQAGIDKGKWRTTGRVVEVCGHDSYLIEMDRSGRTSKHRRSFLKPMKPNLVKIMETSGAAATPASMPPTPEKVPEYLRQAPTSMSQVKTRMAGKVSEPSSKVQTTSPNKTKLAGKVPELSTRVLRSARR